jgi:predicted ATPase with chaperone activity
MRARDPPDVWSRRGRKRSHGDTNALMLRGPGTGTSMLARRLTPMLPAMPLAEALETTRIHRMAGLTGGRRTFVTTRPCRPLPQMQPSCAVHWTNLDRSAS